MGYSKKFAKFFDFHPYFQQGAKINGKLACVNVGEQANKNMRARASGRHGSNGLISPIYLSNRKNKWSMDAVHVWLVQANA